MGIKHKKPLFVLLFLLMGMAVFAQENANSEPATPLPADAEPSFRLSDSDSGVLFLQRLAWESARYAVRYMIVLERKNESNGLWMEVLRRNISNDATYIDVSVPAGQYRYRVSSFNILDQLDKQTDWEEFTVIQALQPSIVSFSPAAFYFDRLTPRILTLNGENLLPDTDMYLVSKNVLDAEGNPLIIKPREQHRNELGETARLIFNEEDLVAGKYEVFAKNPGGLETRTGEFSISLAKPFDINVSGGYIPMLTLFGQRDYYLNKVFVPLSLATKASFIPFKWKFGNLGAEFSSSWSLLKSRQTNSYGQRIDSTAHLFIVDLGVLFQYWIIPKRLSVNGSLGFGFAGILNYHFVHDPGGKGPSMNAAAFNYYLGSSVQWLFFKQIFIEGSLDFLHVAHKDIPTGFVRIGIFGGYQF